MLLYVIAIIAIILTLLYIYSPTTYKRTSAQVLQASSDTQTSAQDLQLSSETRTSAQDLQPSAETLLGTEENSEEVQRHVAETKENTTGTASDGNIEERHNTKRWQSQKRSWWQKPFFKSFPTDENSMLAIDEDEMNMFRSFVDEKALVQEMKKYRTYHGMIRYIDENIGLWKHQNLNVAVVGGSGAGKSSLINALRNLKAFDVLAAPVGLTETTLEVKSYRYAHNDKVTLWDVPGIGTLKFTQKEYLKAIQFEKYDVLILVFSVRVHENDMWLANVAKSQRKRALFVRTKIDLDMMNAKRDHPNFDEAKQLEKVKSDIEKNLSDAKLKPSKDVFLVASAEPDKYDFSKLSAKLKDLLNRKAVAIRRLILNCVEKDINEKKLSFKNTKFLRKSFAAICGFLPEMFDTPLTNWSLKGLYEEALLVFCLEDIKTDYRLTNAAEPKQVQVFDIPLPIPLLIRSLMSMSESIDQLPEKMAVIELDRVKERLKVLCQELSPL